MKKKFFFEIKFTLYFNIVKWNFGLIIWLKGVEGLVLAVSGRILFSFRLRLKSSFIIILTFRCWRLRCDFEPGIHLPYWPLCGHLQQYMWFLAVFSDAPEILQTHAKLQIIHSKYEFRRTSAHCNQGENSNSIVSHIYWYNSKVTLPIYH